MIRLVVSAHEIPNGSTVTKVKGEQPYIIRDRIAIFENNKLVNSIEKPGYRILQGDNYLTLISGTTDLIWHATDRDACLFCQKVRDSGSE